MKKALLFSALVLLLAACSKARYSSEPVFVTGEFQRAERAREDSEQFGENLQAAQEISLRKLVTSSNLQLRVDNLNDGVTALNEIMVKYHTYASSLNIHENSRDYTLRVPAAHYNSLLDEIKKMGNIIRFNETTDDVTLRYFDLESRLNTKRELIVTFQNYLRRANNIEEILSVERRIAELQAEIDDVGRQFRLLSDLIDYSTIRFELLGPISALNFGRETIWERIKNLTFGFRDYVSTIIIILLAIVVYGIPTLLIILLLYWLFFGKIGILKKSFKIVSGKISQKK